MDFYFCGINAEKVYSLKVEDSASKLLSITLSTSTETENLDYLVLYHYQWTVFQITCCLPSVLNGASERHRDETNSIVLGECTSTWCYRAPHATVLTLVDTGSSSVQYCNPALSRKTAYNKMKYSVMLLTNKWIKSKRIPEMEWIT